MNDTTKGAALDAVPALEKWLGTWSDSIPAQAYRDLCAIQAALAQPPAGAEAVTDAVLEARRLFDSGEITPHGAAPYFVEWLRKQALSNEAEFPKAAVQFNATAELIDRLASTPPDARDAAPDWSKRKPTHAGVYGVRGFNAGHPLEDQFEAIVAVRLYEDELICNLHRSTGDDDFDSWPLVADMSDKFEWYEYVAIAGRQS